MKKVHPENSSLDAIVTRSDLLIESTQCNKIVIYQNNKTCRCGKEVEAHSPELVEKFREELNSKKMEIWSSKAALAICQHTYDVFGEIQFQGSSDNLANYVKVPNIFSTESMESIMGVLFGCKSDSKLESNETPIYWSMRMPELVISITGGANSISLKHDLKETFGKALVKVATDTNALITSGGSYTGCMKLVGEAFKKNALSVDPSKIVNLLGIANWDTVYNKSCLLNQEKKDSFVAEYELIKQKESKDVLLDPNHSHFLLVETGKALGAEVPFRAALERFISNSLKIPIIVLVVGGGFRTAESIEQAVQRETPCVFLESSGEVADIFAFVINRIQKVLEKNKEKKDFKITSFLQDPQFKEEIRSKIIEKCFKDTVKDPVIDTKIESIMTSIEKAVLKDEEKLKFLTVCRPVNEKADIDVAILRALLKIHSTVSDANANLEVQRNLQTQLKLALSWDRVDIARNYIFTNKNIEKMGSLDEAMIIALTKNRLEFVKLFIENGFSIKNFVTDEVLIKLYNQTPEKTPINRYIRRQSGRKLGRLSFKQIGSAIESLLENFYKHRFTTEARLAKINSYELERIISGATEIKEKNILHAIETVASPNTLKKPDGIEEKCEYPEHELFMFSILSGWTEMAKLFCKDGRNALIHILFASKIFKSFAEFFEDETACFNEDAENLEKLACDILQACYENDVDNAKVTITRKVPEFDYSTCIQAAILAKDLDFISHTCFQTVVTRHWYNKIDPDINKLELGLYILVPFLSPYYFWYRRRKQIHSNQRAFDEETTSQSDETNIFGSKVRLAESTSPTEYSKTRFNPIKSFRDFLSTPLVKFAYHQSFYILFLLMFSYVLLCDFNTIYDADPTTSQGLVIAIPEVVLIIWVSTFTIELFRKYLLNEKKTLKARIKSFLFDFWNIIDIISISIYVTGMILRFIPDESCHKASRIILAIDIIFWFFKSLYTYLFLKSVGPKLYMIGQQTIQLAYFMLIVFLFIFAFGVCSHALLYQNSPLDLTLFSNIFLPSYFIMGGEYFTQPTIMAAAQNKCTDENLYPYDTCPDSVGSSVTLPIYCLYLLFMNILLINLIIAIFNNTYDAIEAEGKQIWKFQRYGLVYDYCYKPVLFPPFTIFYYIFSMINFIVQAVRTFIIKKPIDNSKMSRLKKVLKFFSRDLDSCFVHDFKFPIEEIRIMKWEKFCTNELFLKHETDSKDTVEFKIEDSQEKINDLASRLDQFIDNEPENLEERIELLEQNLKKTLNLLKPRNIF